MKSTYLYMLDTNAASVLIRGHDSTALQLLVAERDACISVITEAEIRFGVQRKPQATKLAKAVDVFLRDMPCLPWTSATAETYAELRTRMEIQGIGLSAMDLLIATHALAEDCTLISADRAFTKVPGLRVLDWSAATDE
jgi:tRNA(fMet)-specific endonuclease VapC